MIELEDRILEQAIEARETGRISRAKMRETYEVPRTCSSGSRSSGC